MRSAVRTPNRIGIRDGQVVDFEMNKVCAAGTGSFVEEQANRMEVSLEEIGNSALKANVPIDLGERCTVLMESKIAAELAAGTDQEDICAGLCRSIVRNYLNRVVGNKRKGEHMLPFRAESCITRESLRLSMKCLENGFTSRRFTM